MGTYTIGNEICIKPLGLHSILDQQSIRSHDVRSKIRFHFFSHSDMVCLHMLADWHRFIYRTEYKSQSKEAEAYGRNISSFSHLLRSTVTKGDIRSCPVSLEHNTRAVYGDNLSLKASWRLWDIRLCYPIFRQLLLAFSLQGLGYYFKFCALHPIYDIESVTFIPISADDTYSKIGGTISSSKLPQNIVLVCPVRQIGHLPR